MSDHWSLRGLCREHRDLIWFPPTHMKSTQCGEMKAVCRACPVQGDCLHHAMTLPEVSGIWGGLTEAERHKLAKTRDVDRRRLLEMA